MDLFDYMRETAKEAEAALASRLRARTLDEVVGQQHIVGKDKLLYRAILADTKNPVHLIKKISAAMAATSAKTVNVTISKNGTEFTFKTEAFSLRGDCGSHYNSWSIVAADRRKFEQLFGRSADYTPEEIMYLLDLAAELKEKKKKGQPVDCLRGRNVALIFEKTSTRTRCSFEVAAHDLGMGTTYLDPSGSQIGKKESIADTARVLGRMYDGIEYRGFGQEIVEELAAQAGVPVFNGLTNEFHPTQILADFLTIREHFGKLEGVKLVYLGDARFNMGNSLMVGCAKMGLNFTACAPKAYFPDPELVKTCEARAKEIAFGHAGLSAAAVVRCAVELDHHDGHAGNHGSGCCEYEIDFKSGGYEYEYTVDAVTGEILEFKQELDG